MYTALMTSALITCSPISTPGESCTARFVQEQVEQGRRYLQNSEFLGQGSRAVFEELFEIVNQCNVPDWDGYGAEPVSNEAFLKAYFFLEAMPLGMQPPSIGAEPDGQITLEWYKSTRRTLSISVSPEGDLHYSALIGTNKAYGTEAFFGEIPTPIIELINRVLNA
jgi:hypothetical protein